MSLYLLQRKYGDIGYDEYTDHLVRAGSEKAARRLANQKTGDEGCIWDDESLVTCKKVREHGNRKMIISSFNAG